MTDLLGRYAEQHPESGYARRLLGTSRDAAHAAAVHEPDVRS
jgi:hypothetical protein